MRTLLLLLALAVPFAIVGALVTVLIVIIGNQTKR
jgi:hypothetical protein